MRRRRERRNGTVGNNEILDGIVASQDPPERRLYDGDGEDDDGDNDDGRLFAAYEDMHPGDTGSRSMTLTAALRERFDHRPDLIICDDGDLD